VTKRRRKKQREGERNRERERERERESFFLGQKSTSYFGRQSFFMSVIIHYLHNTFIDNIKMPSKDGSTLAKVKRNSTMRKAKKSSAWATLTALFDDIKYRHVEGSVVPAHVCEAFFNWLVYCGVIDEN